MGFATKFRLALVAALVLALSPGIYAAVKAAGYGRCSYCNCKGYEGCARTCGNCGHNFGYHY